MIVCNGNLLGYAVLGKVLKYNFHAPYPLLPLHNAYNNSSPTGNDTIYQLLRWNETNTRERKSQDITKFYSLGLGHKSSLTGLSIDCPERVWAVPLWYKHGDYKDLFFLLVKNVPELTW